jgi:hypothetical protein
MCEMGLMMNTRNEQEHIEYLLTKEAVAYWITKNGIEKIWAMFRDSEFDNIKQFYLKEHGLPIDSVIVGL